MAPPKYIRGKKLKNEIYDPFPTGFAVAGQCDQMLKLKVAKFLQKDAQNSFHLKSDVFKITP